MNQVEIEYHRQYRAKNRERRVAYSRKYYADHTESANARSREYVLRRKYGIEPEEYDRMFVNQGGLCSLCYRPLPGGRTAVVDHDHITEKVRGLLHNQCNVAIGLLGHDPMRVRLAVTYLENHLPGTKDAP